MQISAKEVIKEDEKTTNESSSVNTVLQSSNKRSSFNLKKIVVSILGLGLLGAGGFVAYQNQDAILEVFQSSELERSRDGAFNSTFKLKTETIAQDIVDKKMIEMKTLVAEYDARINEFKLDLETTKNINKSLETKINEQNGILATIQQNDNSDSKIILDFESTINNALLEMKNVQNDQDKNKILLQKTVQATLTLIKENKMIDKDLEAKIYKKVYSEFKKVFDNQRFRLNDLSIIESKLNEVLSVNKEILKDLNRTKIENKKLKNSQKDLNNKIKKLSLDMEGSKVVSNNHSPSKNNVINLLKNNKPNNAIVIDKQSNTTIPKYKIQGIIDSRLAYIKVVGEGNKARAYTVGDTLEGYGKILKMESSSIITEQGTLRRERR